MALLRLYSRPFRVVHGHGAAVVDVVAALAVGEDLVALDGLGVAGASGLVPSVFRRGRRS